MFRMLIISQEIECETTIRAFDAVFSNKIVACFIWMINTDPFYHRKMFHPLVLRLEIAHWQYFTYSSTNTLWQNLFFSLIRLFQHFFSKVSIFLRFQYDLRLLFGLLTEWNFFKISFFCPWLLLMKHFFSLHVIKIIAFTLYPIMRDFSGEIIFSWVIRGLPGVDYSLAI